MVVLPDLGGSDGVSGAGVSVETWVNSISGFGIFAEQASGWELQEMFPFNLALHKSSDCNPFDLFHPSGLKQFYVISVLQARTA